MPMFSFEGTSPTIHPTAWIAPTAVLIGDVTVEEGASVWFGTVLRADFGPIVISRGANVQDNSVMHGGPDATVLGEGATIGHGCVVHGAKIGKEALIGNGATVLDGVSVGDGTLVAAGATVTPGTTLGDRVIAVGAPARERGPIEGSAKHWAEHNQQAYRDLAQRYAASCEPVADSQG